MNSESGQRLSLEELKQRNAPQPQIQSTPQVQIPKSSESHPTKAEWAEMMDYIYTLTYHAERQNGYLRKVSERLERCPTQTQMEDLTKAVKHLAWVTEQAGKPKERSFSLPKFRLSRLHLPHLDGPTWAVPLMALAALLLLWWAWAEYWNNLSLLSL